MAWDAEERRRDFLRKTGRPSLLRADSPEVQWASSKVRSYHNRGMSLAMMAEETGLGRDTILRLDSSRPGGLFRSSFVKIQGMRFVYAESRQGRYVPIQGTQRRLQALRAEGYTTKFLVRELGGGGTAHIIRLIEGERPDQPMGKVFSGTARKVAVLYDRLAGQDPVKMGVTPRGVAYSKTRAAQKGWLPSYYWNPETIDDPSAEPNWTGACGTPFGWRVHNVQKTRVCAPCLIAKAAHPVRFSGDRFRALREKRGLSGQDVADALGIHNTVVYRWQLGTSSPRKNGLLERLLVLLDATYDDLFEEVDAR